MGCGCDVFIGSYTKAERVEEFMHEFFLACNQSMPVKGKFLEEATPTPFVSSCFVYVNPPPTHPTFTRTAPHPIAHSLSSALPFACRTCSGSLLCARCLSSR